MGDIYEKRQNVSKFNLKKSQNIRNKFLQFIQINNQELNCKMGLDMNF